MKKILIIEAHPREDSFCNSLVGRYVAGAEQNQADVRILRLRDLDLEPWLKYGWDRNHDSVPDSGWLDDAKKLITWSEHIVFAYPTYWALPPALLTLFIEVIITSGFAFKYHKPLWGRIPRWERRLKGRSASVLVTMDSPPIFMKLHDRDPGGKMMNDVLRFTGMALKGKHYFGSVVLSSEPRRQQWLTDAFQAGMKDSREPRRPVAACRRRGPASRESSGRDGSSARPPSSTLSNP